MRPRRADMLGYRWPLARRAVWASMTMSDGRQRAIVLPLLARGMEVISQKSRGIEVISQKSRGIEVIFPFFNRLIRLMRRSLIHLQASQGICFTRTNPGACQQLLQS